MWPPLLSKYCNFLDSRNKVVQKDELSSFGFLQIPYLQPYLATIIGGLLIGVKGSWKEWNNQSAHTGDHVHP